jgi:hypothetical protein
MHKQLFDDTANKLLNNSIIQVLDKTYRIHEVEMYYHNQDHPDEYTHKHPKQMENNQFYPHQYKSGGYKAGTYKCMDICFGNKETNTYFGVLIRTIENLVTHEFFTGPCICMREVLSNFGCSEFKEFFEHHSIDEIKLIDQPLVNETIYIGPRVGLSDKYPVYQDKYYRYATNIKQIKKQKKFYILGAQ